MVHFHMRSETKEGERRTSLTPAAAKQLLDAGHTVTVEEFPDRCYPDKDYAAVGCTIAANGTWEKPGAVDKDAIIVGLKELPDGKSALPHTHLMFAHCFKGQDGWRDVMQRFIDGNGKLYDLEFLRDESGRRKVAFGRSAGFCGMGTGILAWAHQFQSNAAMTAAKFPQDIFYPSKGEFIEHAKSCIKLAGRQPRIMIIGALGRCGGGAVEMAVDSGIPEANILKWDMAETSKGGPFPEILDVDIFVNCIYLDPTSTTPAFLTKDMLEKQRNCSVMVDVSCDPNNPKNPVPVYGAITYLKDPTLRVVEPELPAVGAAMKALRTVGVEGFGTVAEGAKGKVQKAENGDLEVVMDGNKGVFAYTRASFAPVEGTLKAGFDVIAIDHLPALVPCESSDDFSSGLIPMLLDIVDDKDKVWERATATYTEKVEEMKRSKM